MTVDLNSGMGELEDPELVGDEAAMERTIRLALAAGVAISGHPGYPDRARFRRVEMPLPAAAQRLGVPVVRVKPHEALK
jgi:hypothetical protein